jgi:DNA-binding transcriptional regulator YbjK
VVEVPVTGETPKGETRRDALIEAAARLLIREGLRSLTHRAVAAEAGLPLASTTYYFADLDELEAAAARQIAEHWHRESRRLVQQLSRRARSVRTVSRLCTLITLGPPDERRTPLWRCETFVDACRHERLREVVAQWTPESDQLVGEVLERSGYPLKPDRLGLLCAAIDGAILRSVAAAIDAAPAVERVVAAELDASMTQA